MTTSPFVCCPNCQIMFDDFNRANGGPGCLWESRQGSWSINNHHLHESGNEGALILARRCLPDLGFYLSADTPEVQSGAKYRLIANYVNDDNYHFAEFEFSATELTMRLFKRTNGNNGNPLVERTWSAGFVGYDQTFILFLSPKIFWATQKSAPYEVWITEPDLLEDGYAAGLGNGSSIAIDYDDFLLQENGDVTPGCAKVACRCDDIPLPMNLTAHCSFSGGYGYCDPVDVSLRAHEPGSPQFAAGEWFGTAIVDCSDCPGILESFELSVEFRCGCSGNPSKRFWVSAVGGGGQGTACEDDGPVGCDSLSIPFTDMFFRDNPGDCTEESTEQVYLSIEITE